jgi:hypothetical protein
MDPVRIRAAKWLHVLAIVSAYLSVAVLNVAAFLMVLRRTDLNLAVMTLCSVVISVSAALFLYRSSVSSPDRETRCRKCGYILRGIREPRCSECGERI